MGKKLLALVILAMGLNAFAEETMGEKAAATGNDVKREAKKVGHRTQELVCAEGDAKCLAEKAEHRATEGGDYVHDKAVEAKNAVDTDKPKKK
jgi:hypothetical protein